ncbi:MAG: hypothetical protein WCC30_10525 [Candidatus Dormiibacterota bacterium]
MPAIKGGGVDGGGTGMRRIVAATSGRLGGGDGAGAAGEGVPGLPAPAWSGAGAQEGTAGGGWFEEGVDG